MLPSLSGLSLLGPEAPEEPDVGTFGDLPTEVVRRVIGHVWQETILDLELWSKLPNPGNTYGEVSLKLFVKSTEGDRVQAHLTQSFFETVLDIAYNRMYEMERVKSPTLHGEGKHVIINDKRVGYYVVSRKPRASYDLNSDDANEGVENYSDIVVSDDKILQIMHYGMQGLAAKLLDLVRLDPNTVDFSNPRGPIGKPIKILRDTNANHVRGHAQAYMSSVGYVVCPDGDSVVSMVTMRVRSAEMYTPFFPELVVVLLGESMPKAVNMGTNAESRHT